MMLPLIFLTIVTNIGSVHYQLIQLLSAPVMNKQLKIRGSWPLAVCLQFHGTDIWLYQCSHHDVLTSNNIEWLPKLIVNQSNGTILTPGCGGDWLRCVVHNFMGNAQQRLPTSWGRGWKISCPEKGDDAGRKKLKLNSKKARPCALPAALFNL